jgi:phage protein D
VIAALHNLAGEHDLQPCIASKLDHIATSHLDQTEESDANPLTRSGRYDAVAAIKAVALTFCQLAWA